MITSTFVNMAVTTAILRDEGVLKRMRGTPIPNWVYMTGRIGSTAAVMVVMCVATLGLGAAAYGVTVRSSTLPGTVIALLLGTACFTALGIGIVRHIPSADSAPAIVNFLILPLTFISGVWFVTDKIPSVLQGIADVFPIHALADSLQYAFDPRTHGAGLKGRTC